MIQFVLKVVYMSLAVLNLYRCCIIRVSQFNWPKLLRVVNVQVKNLAFNASTIITNAYFSMKNSGIMISRLSITIWD